MVGGHNRPSCNEIILQITDTPNMVATINYHMINYAVDYWTKYGPHFSLLLFNGNKHTWHDHYNGSLIFIFKNDATNNKQARYG